MSCGNAMILLHRSLDGGLSPQERSALNVHTEACAACRAEQDAQQRLTRLAGRWAARASEQSDPGEAFTAQVLSRLDRPASPRPSVWLPLAASLLGLSLLPLTPGISSLWAGLPVPPLMALSGWLGANLTALPGAARAALQLPQAAFVPAWTTMGLFGVFLLNAGFCVHARRRSAS